jgi:hypothetical protein
MLTVAPLAARNINEDGLEKVYIHSIVLDRALASLTGFLIVRYVRCVVISPTINPVQAT